MLLYDPSHGRASAACNIYANALLLCGIAQRPDIEAETETRVVVRGQDDAEELI
jgi:hypothetical protein